MNKPLSYEELRDIQQKEKKSPYLSELRPDFYESLLARIKELEKECTQEEARDQSSPKLILLRDELKNTHQLLEDIYGSRESKIIKLAMSALRGGSAETKQMLPKELELFEQIKALLANTKVKILTKEEEGSAPQPSTKEIVIVRITKDLPSFVGTDLQTYNLKREDVVTLPKETAEILIKQGNALKVNLQ
jgi:DNA replication initiation complex subunit (GINS family)